MRERLESNLEKLAVQTRRAQVGVFQLLPTCPQFGERFCTAGRWSASCDLFGGRVGPWWACFRSGSKSEPGAKAAEPQSTQMRRWSFVVSGFVFNVIPFLLQLPQAADAECS